MDIYRCFVDNPIGPCKTSTGATDLWQLPVWILSCIHGLACVVFASPWEVLLNTNRIALLKGTKYVGDFASQATVQKIPLNWELSRIRPFALSTNRSSKSSICPVSFDPYFFQVWLNNIKSRCSVQSLCALKSKQNATY